MRTGDDSLSKESPSLAAPLVKELHCEAGVRRNPREVCALHRWEARVERLVCADLVRLVAGCGDQNQWARQDLRLDRRHHTYRHRDGIRLHSTD